MREIVRRYNAQGAEGVADGHQRRPGGARPLLGETQRLELAATIDTPVPAVLGGGLWSGRKVALWVQAATRRAIHPQQGCVYLRQLGFGLRVPRMWARQGRAHRPLCAEDHRYSWMYVYGFVHPHSGRSEWWLLGGVNTPAMSAVLAEFAQVVGAGRDKRVLLVLDQAGWHVSKELVVPEGIHLIHLPASTPELQPAERLWPPLREALANESFADLAALDARVDARCTQLSAQRAFIAGCTRYH